MTTLAEFDTVRAQLVDHPLYSRITTEDRLRIFMEHHVFAVWDFFTLLKRLQTEVTTVTLPWRPRGQADHGRFIMEIVLAEETDEDIDGGYISHFELYRRAMVELGADTGPIDGFLAALDSGLGPMAALEAGKILGSVREFVSHTLDVALHGAPHEVASSFCHGRENLLPDGVLSPMLQCGQCARERADVPTLPGPPHNVGSRRARPAGAAPARIAVRRRPNPRGRSRRRRGDPGTHRVVGRRPRGIRRCSLSSSRSVGGRSRSGVTDVTFFPVTSCRAVRS
jgi:DUF3050 family protein